ncbi:ABC transporter substrate-binding protein [soil metagenome]
MVPDRQQIAEKKLSRRKFSFGAGLGSLALLSGCSIGEDDQPPEPTPTLELTATPEVEPTATQQTIGSPVPGYGDESRWSGRVLTVAAWGGDYQDAQREAFFDPFSAATGATVQEKVADISTLRSQVEDGNVLWDLLTVPMEDLIILGREGFLTPLSYEVIDATPLYPEVVQEFGVGSAYYSTVLTYPSESAAAPATWADFWNTHAAIEGEEQDLAQYRSLQRSPMGTLEFALLADEAPLESLYPLDVDRAFASLDRLRNQVLVWWQESKEPIELVAAGQVGMATVWNSRIDQLDLGAQVRILWYQGMLSADAWVIPLGAENTDVAMDFISFATRAIPSANFSRVAPYGPVNRDAFELLRRDRVDILPSSPANKPLQFVKNWEYWAENRDELTLRFEDWLLDAGPATPAAAETA